MKININKFNQGGSTVVFRTVNTFLDLPLQPMVSPFLEGKKQEGKDEKDDSKLDVIDQPVWNDLIKLIQDGKMLPSDLNKVMSDYRKLMTSPKFDKNMQMGEWYSLAGTISTAIKNAEFYNQSMKRAETQDSLGDHAIDANGNIYVIDSKTNSVKKVTKDNFNRKKHLALTYQELLLIRAYDNSFAFNSDAIFSTYGSVGYSKVQNYIWQIVRALGNEESSQKEYESIAMIAGSDLREPTKAQREGFYELLLSYENLGADGLVLVLRESKSPNIKAAISYISQALPKLYRNVLDAELKISYNNNVKVSDIIETAIYAGANFKVGYEKKYDQSASNAASTSNGSGKKATLYPVEEALSGEMLSTKIEFSDPSNKNQTKFEILGVSLPLMTNIGSTKVQGSGPLALLFNKLDSFGMLVDRDLVYFGTQKVSSFDLDKIVYDGNSMAIGWVPVNDDGSIDFVSFLKFNKATKEADDIITKNGVTDQSEKNKIRQECYKKNNLDLKMDENGEFYQDLNMERFAIIWGFAEDDNIGDESKNIFSKELTGDDEDTVNDYMESLYDNHEAKNPNGTWASMTNNTYKAPVFMKLKDRPEVLAQIYSRHGSVVEQNTMQLNANWVDYRYPDNDNDDSPIESGSSNL